MVRVATLFLACALALPPEDKIKELEMLRDFFYNSYPGYSFFFSETAVPPHVVTWEKIGIEYEGVKIWKRRRLGGAA